MKQTISQANLEFGASYFFLHYQVGRDPEVPSDVAVGECPEDDPLETTH